jgi:hypothetical protein
MSDPLQIHHGTHIRDVAISPDGLTILIATDRDETRMWDAFIGKPIGPPIGRVGGRLARFTADGRMAVGGAPDGRIAFWEVPAPLNGAVERVRLWIESEAKMELDSHDMIHVLSADAIKARLLRLEELGGPPMR